MSAQDSNSGPFQDFNYNPDAAEEEARESCRSSLQAVENNHHHLHAGRMGGAGGQMFFDNNNSTNVLLDGLSPAAMLSQHTTLPSATARYLMSQQHQLRLGGGGVLPLLQQSNISQHLQPGHGLPLNISPAMMAANQTHLNYSAYLQAPHLLGNSFLSSLATAQSPHPGVVSSLFNNLLDTNSTASRDLTLSTGTGLLDPTAIHNSIGRGLLGGSSTADVFQSSLLSSKQVPPRKRPPVKRTKKPKDYPRRPLSAYNLFFRDERKRILESIPGSSSCQEEDVDKVADPSSTKKRTPHGKVSFENLAKMIGARWKEVDDEQLKQYKAQSAKDHERYAKDMKKYDEKLEALKAEEERQIAATKQPKVAAREKDSQKEEEDENEVSSRTSSCEDSAASPLIPRDALVQDNKDATALPLSREHSNKRKRGFFKEMEESSVQSSNNDESHVPLITAPQLFPESVQLSTRFDSNSGQSLTRTNQVLTTLAAVKDHHRRATMDDLYRGLLVNDEREFGRSRLADVTTYMGTGGGSEAPGNNTLRNIQDYLQEQERFVVGDTASLRNDKDNGE